MALRRFVVLGFVVLWIANSAVAQWSSNPAVNLAIADAANDQVQPKVRLMSTGGAYISWFDNRTGGYDPYLQQINKVGVEQFSHNGVLIADRSVSSTEDYGLAVDSNDNAAMAYGLVNFSSLGAQLVAPNGSFLWGPAGITINTPGGSHSPKVAATSDGKYVVAWSEGSVLSIVLQKYDLNGALQWGPVIYTDPPTSRNLFLCDLQPSDSGSVIVEWFRCAGSNCATSAHHLYTQKYDANGNPAWNGGTPVILFNGTSTANGYFPTCLPDGAGGAVYGWYETGGSQLCYVQHIDSTGAEVFAHNGVACTVATAGRMRISAALGFDATSGDIFLGWSEVTIPTQDMWGVRAQKVSAAGARQWGDEGVSIKPLNGNQTSFVHTDAWSGGCIVSYFDATSILTGLVKAARLDSGGTQIWPGSPITPSSRDTGKGRLDAILDGCGMSMLVWSDGASGGSQDVLAQNVRANGSLGPPVITPGDTNCDGLVNLADVDPFVLEMLDPSAYAASHPCCDGAAADMNHDGHMDGDDCDGLVRALTGP